MTNQINKLEGPAARTFISAGNARFSVLNSTTGNRFTYRVRASKDGSVWFVSVLTGSDNDSDYTYLGFIRGGSYVHGGSKSRVGADAPSARAFAWIWPRLDRLPGAVEIWHAGCCGRCGRTLTVPSSIASGLGPDCAEIMGLVA